MAGDRGLKLSTARSSAWQLRAPCSRTRRRDFDKATSALDLANECAVQAELRGTAQNKTMLVITHRLSTVMDAHEILVKEEGHIAERGTHAELMDMV